MRIRIADKNLGEVIINVYTDIGKSEEYTIKSLAILQMMCMNKEDSPEKFSEFIKIIKDAVNKANSLYRGINADEPADPTSHFGD